MANLASKVSAAQDALVAVLAGVTELGDFKPVYGWPGVDLPERKVWVDDDATTERESPLTRGGQIVGQDESFNLKIVLHVHRTKLSAAEVRDLADAAEAKILAALAQDPTLGGVVGFCRVTGIERKGGFWDEKATKRYSDRLITVGCQTNQW